MASINLPADQQVKEDKRLVDLSRKLSGFLRHSFCVCINSKGYCSVKNLGIHFSKKMTYDILIKIIEMEKKNVEIGKKERYHLIFENGEYMVKAYQGHSNHVKDVKIGWKLLTLEDFDSGKIIAHGTKLATLDCILQVGNGLKRMKRDCIHFAFDILKIREKSEVVIIMNVQLCLEHGIQFFCAENNVVLSEGVGTTGMIPYMYFQKVIDLRTGLEILF